MVGKVNGRVDPFEANEVALNPFTKCEILDIDMACTRRRFVGIAHNRAAVVVLVDETQRCQLCHYDIVVAQLAALGFIKSV